MSITVFDHLPDGREVQAIWLRGPLLTARVLTLGATVQDLRREGIAHPLVLGYDSAAPYFAEGLYVGALVGRFANRIGGGRFVLAGRAHQVDTNYLGRHLLHGGRDGIHHQLWRIADLAEDRVTLALDLPDGHMGFPGRLSIRAEIAVAGDALSFDLCATSDAATPCNLAHHGYFTLDPGGDIRAQHLQIAAEHYLPVDPDLIPTGEIAPVAGTDFDFRSPRVIGGAGYDHNFCLSDRRQPLRPVARLQGGGLAMQIETTEPGLQLYDGRHFERPFAGVALECQGWPDAPNRPGFPDSILRPGAEYHALTRYRFAP